jgi:hypothetical protein
MSHLLPISSRDSRLCQMTLLAARQPPTSNLQPPCTCCRLLFPPESKLSEREIQVRVTLLAQSSCALLQAWHHHSIDSLFRVHSISQMGKHIRQFWIDFIRNGDQDLSALSPAKEHGMYAFYLLRGPLPHPTSLNVPDFESSTFVCNSGCGTPLGQI